MFQKYQHLVRLGNKEAQDIEKGDCYVFPKLDGTNSSLWMDEQGVIKAGSRNRELTLQKDNAGFYAWVIENIEKFLPFFNEHPRLRLYGEWLVPHSLKCYNADAWRNFYVFDVCAIDETKLDDYQQSPLVYLSYDEYAPLLNSHNITYIEPLARLQNPTADQLIELTKKNFYLLNEDRGVWGEGIVVKRYGYKNMYGRTTWAKVIAEGFTNSVATKPPAPRHGEEIASAFVEKYVDEHLVNKVYAKIENECGEFTNKHIGRLLQTVFYDLVNEETYNFIKKNKMPTLNFKAVQSLTFQKVKQIRTDLF
jgi:hypothetical protein